MSSKIKFVFWILIVVAVALAILALGSSFLSQRCGKRIREAEQRKVQFVGPTGAPHIVGPPGPPPGY